MERSAARLMTRRKALKISRAEAVQRRCKPQNPRGIAPGIRVYPLPLICSQNWRFGLAMLSPKSVKFSRPGVTPSGAPRMRIRTMVQGVGSKVR